MTAFNPFAPQDYGGRVAPQTQAQMNSGGNLLDRVNAMGGIDGANYGGAAHNAALGQYHQDRGTGNRAQGWQNAVMGQLTQGPRTVTAAQYPQWGRAQTGPGAGFGGVQNMPQMPRPAGPLGYAQGGPTGGQIGGPGMYPGGPGSGPNQMMQLLERFRSQGWQP